ncbi:MAG: tryptophan synthase subunit alpha [Acidobacteria bacterium]|nr:tryptophan synthase subunit alpha [Acidobacteriota bacterium]
MSTRIGQRWQELGERADKALIGFVVAGDPDLPKSAEIVLALAGAGVDMVELGVPFSEPIADGLVIQRSGERALRQGAYLPAILDLVKGVRSKSEVPLLLMTYMNPILRYGLERFTADAVASGCDGVLVTDLSVEEAEPFVAEMHRKRLDTVFLAAPTSTDQRLKRVVEYSTGFVYAVSRAGTTGAKDTLSSAIEPLLTRLRAMTSLPIAAGFGISRPEHLAQLAPMADGVVVGSALVKVIEEHPDDPASHAAKFARWLRTGYKESGVGSQKSE